MSHLPTSNNKSLRLPASNNKNIEKTATKKSPSFYGTTKASNVNNPLILGFSIISAHSYKNERITKNKDYPMMTANNATKKQNNSDPLILVALTESICSCESKLANTKNDDNR